MNVDANNKCCGVCELCKYKGKTIEGKSHFYGNSYYTCTLENVNIIKSNK